MNKIEIVEKLKAHAPMIFDIIHREDMGFEYTVVCTEGAIF